ncbi:MAG: hypothetical protein K8S97_16360 [Anaerolineae bacterium]|nr:hypothetical protein [Anaerolineae bacterium]
MADWTTPKEWEDSELVTAALLNTHLRDNLTYLYDNLSLRAMLWHMNSIVTAGNALARTMTTSQMFGFHHRQDVAADGDTFTQSFVLAPGTYTFYALGKKTYSSGKVDWSLDGSTIVTGQDWNDASTFNIIMSVASVQVGDTDGGRHVLQGTINGTSGGAGDYRLDLTAMWFVPSADA